MELKEALLEPRAYPHRPAEITTLETHISWIFFAGDEVYKVKKPVSLGFLDFSTPARRRHFCFEEVRLNRRLAPSVYLGVSEIREEADGSILVGAGTGRVIETAVRMRRLPEHRMLDHLLDAGEVDNDQMNALAKVLADFHACAEIAGSYGTRASIAATNRENLERCLPFTGDAGPPLLSRELHSFLGEWIDSFLTEHSELFDDRVAKGRIREGHGDLHAGNICLTRPGVDGVAIFDCIEFDRRYRCVDVAADLAFLLMDLDLRGFRAFGGYLLKRYGELAGDPDLDALIGFYKLERSIVRGMVAGLQVADQPTSQREGAAEKSSGYFELAATYALGPVVIAICGLPGSGKSRLAHHIAPPFEALVVNSDMTRKQLRGVAPERPAGEAAYGADVSKATYGRMLELADRALAHRRPVIFDAGFRSREKRAAITRFAADRGLRLCWVLADADDRTIRARLESRVRSPEQASDADVAVYDALRRDFEPPDEIPDSILCRVLPDTPPRCIRADVIGALIRSRA